MEPRAPRFHTNGMHGEYIVSQKPALLESTSATGTAMPCSPRSNVFWAVTVEPLKLPAAVTINGFSNQDRSNDGLTVVRVLDQLAVTLPVTTKLLPYVEWKDAVLWAKAVAQ